MVDELHTLQSARRGMRQALTSLLYPMAEAAGADTGALQHAFIHSRCILSVLRAVAAAAAAHPEGATRTIKVV